MRKLQRETTEPEKLKALETNIAEYEKALAQHKENPPGGVKSDPEGDAVDRTLFRLLFFFSASMNVF